MTAPLGYARPLYYRHSGRLSVMGFTFAFIASLIAATVLAAVYAYIDLYNPCVSVLTVFAAMAFGVAVGATTGYLLRQGQVRNDGLTVIVSVVVALFALYASWVFWIYALLHQRAVQLTPIDLVTHPAGLGRLILRINEVGVWSIGGSPGHTSTSAAPVKGVFLWLIWLAEAACVVVLSIGATIRFGTALPYCETCRRWCPAAKRLFSTDDADPDVLRQNVEARQFEIFRKLPAADPKRRPWLELALHRCDLCRGLYALTVTRGWFVVGRKGQQQKKEKKLINKLLLSAQETAQLESIRDARASAAAPSQPSGAAPAQPTTEPDSSRSAAERAAQPPVSSSGGPTDPPPPQIGVME